MKISPTREKRIELTYGVGTVYCCIKKMYEAGPTKKPENHDTLGYTDSGTFGHNTQNYRYFYLKFNLTNPIIKLPVLIIIVFCTKIGYRYRHRPTYSYGTGTNIQCCRDAAF
jgi:hypothetical protein